MNKNFNKKHITLYMLIIVALLASVTSYYVFSFSTAREEIQANTTAVPLSFDGSRAYTDVQTQVDFGPRTPGSEGHAKIRDWMRAELESAGWQVEVQESNLLGHVIYNLIAKRNDE